jgi:arylsulfatase A-like enzyme
VPSIFRLPAFVLCLCLASALCAAEKPNVVLIFVDDLGINDLGCYGRKDHRTPRLDALAAAGVRFTSGYCAQPICSPSRAAILTGKHPARLQLTNFLPGRPDAPSQKLLQPVIEGQLQAEEITIAEVLREAGYATGHVGKWHLGVGARFESKAQGFDFIHAGKANTEVGAGEGSKGEYDLTAAAIRFIEENKERPFFLYLAHHTPHIPYAAAEEDQARYQETFSPVYAAVIEQMDRSIGLLLDKLDELRLAEQTMVIFASDNGGLHVVEFEGTPATHNTPYRAGKGYLYEGGLRVPLIIRWPGKIRGGWVSDDPVVLTDLAPTLLDAAGIDPAKRLGPLDGESQLGYLRGGAFEERPIFWYFPHYTNQGGRPAAAMRDGGWKLIVHAEDERAELFHLSDDVGEEDDLAAREPARTTQMREALERWQERIGAQRCGANPEFDAAMHRALYMDRDPTRIPPAASQAAIEREWKPWRAGMNAAVKGRKPRTTPGAGDVRLFARDATVHGQTLRYEPEPHKNTLGFWTEAGDWAEWKFAAPRAGRYEIELQQGCAGGGSEVVVEVGGAALAYTVRDTGHFQQFIQAVVGEVDLPAGEQRLAVKVKKKAGAAVMDLRRVVVRPVPQRAE